MSGEELRAAAQAVVDAAEADDDFDGQFIDWMVPDEKITALRAALAAPSTPEPSAERLAHLIAHYRLRTPFGVYDPPLKEGAGDGQINVPAHNAIKVAERERFEATVALIARDYAAPSTEPALDAALLHRAIVMTLPFEKWITPETAASIAATVARLAESQPSEETR